MKLYTLTFLVVFYCVVLSADCRPDDGKCRFFKTLILISYTKLYFIIDLNANEKTMTELRETDDRQLDTPQNDNGTFYNNICFYK